MTPQEAKSFIEGKLDELTLHLQKVSCRAGIDKRVLQNVQPLRCDVLTDLAECLVVSVCRYIPTEWRRSVYFPADWWQAVKERWAPRWVKTRWPVRYKTWDALAFYPRMRPFETFRGATMRFHPSEMRSDLLRVLVEKEPWRDAPRGEPLDDFGLRRLELIERRADELVEALKDWDLESRLTASVYHARLLLEEALEKGVKKALDAKLPEDLE